MELLVSSLIASICGLIFASWVSATRSNPNIPTIGYDGVLTSYISAFRFLKYGNEILQEGCQKFKGKAFKVPLLDRWLVVINGDRLFETLRTAPETVLSAWEAMHELLQIRYTLGPHALENPFHINLMRTTLTKNLNNLLPHILDETACAYEEEIGSKLSEHDWTPISAEESFQQMLAQVSSRAFVGLPLCRNKEYRTLSIQFTTNVMTAAAIINLFPRKLKPLVGALYDKLSGHQRRMLKFIGPEIEGRRKKYLEYGLDYENKPNDMLTWAMEAATSETEKTTSSLALRILNVNFMSIHTTYVAFAHTIYNLAAQPHYLDILRDEIHMHLSPSGAPSRWSLEEIDRCVRLDSFLKESLRLNGLGAISLPRKAMVSFTLPDGTHIPAGTIITAASTAAHLDAAHYERPEVFDGLRFAALREKEAEADDEGSSEENDVKHRLTSAGPGFLAFGGGKHICPGRFYASLELKCMLIHLVLHFDVKMEDEGVRPKDDWMGPTSMPARDAKVLFRHRKSSE